MTIQRFYRLLFPTAWISLSVVVGAKIRFAHYYAKRPEHALFVPWRNKTSANMSDNRKQFHIPLIVFNNLASPDWKELGEDARGISVKDVVCFVRREQKSSLDLWSKNRYSPKGCKTTQIKFGKNCFLFFWNKGTKAENNLKHFRFTNLTTLQFVTNNIKFSPVLMKPSFGGVTHIFKYDKLPKKYSGVAFNKGEPAQGFQVFSENQIVIKPQTFSCHDGIHISPEKVCDGNQDCADNSDEDFCSCKKRLGPCFLTCFQIYHHWCQKWESKTICPQWNNSPGNHNFFAKRPVNFPSEVACKSNFYDHIFQNDLYHDCEVFGEDEPLLLSLFWNSTNVPCQDPNQVPCLEGHPRCYNISDMCIFQTNKHNQLVPCRNGAHLDNCRMFECNMMFKCPNSYCISWHSICDNKWDCPEGKDETNYCSHFNCTGMFKCSNQFKRCFPLHEICDGANNCPNGNDEYFCDVVKYCPQNCNCIVITLVCTNTAVYPSTKLQTFNFIVLVNVVAAEYTFGDTKNAIFLSVENMNLNFTCKLLPASKLVEINITHTFFKTVKKYCNKQSPILKQIQLSLNGIQLLESKAFGHLKVLWFLNLSHNSIKTFPKDVLWNTTQLRTLSIQGNSLENIEVDTFEWLTSFEVHTTAYHICCLVSPSTSCSAKRPWYISCDDLFPNTAANVTWISVSTCVFVLNTASSMLLFFKESKSSEASIIIPFSICANGILCSVYFFMVWINHKRFTGTFILCEKMWRSSIVCHFASGFFLFFWILDTVLSFLLSLSRFGVVSKPITSKYKTSKYTLRKVILTVIAAASMTTTMTFLFHVTLGTFPHNLCLLLIDPTNSVVLVKILTFLVGACQLISLFDMTYNHILLLSALHASKDTIQKSKSTSDSDGSLILQLSTITFSSICCWIPATVVYLVSSFITKYPQEMIV